MGRHAIRGRFSGIWVVIALLFGFGAARAWADVDRGRYLVDRVMACGNCHSAKGSEARPVRSRHLAGGGVIRDVAPFAGAAPNITPDRETGIGRWSDAEVKGAIREGVSRDGRKLSPPMPFGICAVMSEADLGALVAWLRTLPPRP